MMDIEDFRNMFRAHLSHEIWDKWRKGQLDVSSAATLLTDANTRNFPKRRQIRFLTVGKSIPARIWQTPLK